MVGILLSFWETLFSGAMLVSERVTVCDVFISVCAVPFSSEKNICLVWLIMVDLFVACVFFVSFPVIFMFSPPPKKNNKALLRETNG